MQALGRTVFAFSRDRLLPFSRVWTKIHPMTGTPLNAVWISVFLCIAINLIGLGSYAAISGVFNICAIALDWSYCIPILCKLLFGKFTPGPWHMGKFSKFVNAWACLWTLFVSIIFLLPTSMPVTALTVSSYQLNPPDLPQLMISCQMNYASAFLVLVLISAALYWYISGRKFYHGPIVEAQFEEEQSDSGIMAQEKLVEKDRDFVV
jgi:amino acid transporter